MLSPHVQNPREFYSCSDPRQLSAIRMEKPGVSIAAASHLMASFEEKSGRVSVESNDAASKDEIRT